MLDVESALTRTLYQGEDLHLGANRRAATRRTGQTPCVLHANGGSKFFGPVLHWWWEHANDSERGLGWPQTLASWFPPPGPSNQSRVGRMYSRMYRKKAEAFFAAQLGAGAPARMVIEPVQP